MVSFASSGPQTTFFCQNWSMRMLHDHLLHYLGCKLVTSLFMLQRLGHLLYRIIYLQGRHFFPSKSCMLKILCWTECRIGVQTKLWAMHGSSFTHTLGLWPWLPIYASRFELYALPLHCRWVLIVWGSVHSCQPLLQVWIICSAMPLHCRWVGAVCWCSIPYACQKSTNSPSHLLPLLVA
jgi:hypothetical protein